MAQQAASFLRVEFLLIEVAQVTRPLVGRHVLLARTVFVASGTLEFLAVG